ncbi:uncharacterized protein K460DRAFT_406219 [Cucurbitaria berberidis CBS 394.84]|uniref:SAP domain-containing protein n=1 Tax=Cucurbitaria berberidis CBS 394.84 TaxID=1168544 RepID=A0A9P4L941_9PLEO|nr:uncharacterized protein K460DRAFT_406219 [Cucurbitaria berberidis CBS 394.84]KAF1845992.1 hypothetical protein K460DRAFT_406219 [Cucurbitaria berberidis CBS 394.84]
MSHIQPRSFSAPPTSTGNLSPFSIPLASLPHHMQSRIPTDDDASFVNEAEENEQLQQHFQKQYEAKFLMELRVICKRKQLRVRGNKSELVLRLAQNDMRELNERWI